ncbi:MAG: T9SS type A sorting domain-containing protein [Bacteroidetes bacterium]|nr:T9SS type A sorting domain-containing protein [Bacteroidota bacterium]
MLRNIAYSIVHLNGILYTGISAPSSQKAVYTSSDYGRNWTITNSSVLNNNTIKSIVKVGGNILAASDGGTRGVYISKDNGATWDTTSIKSETDALAVLGTTVFAATGIGVKKSSDNGLTWTTTKNVSGVIDNAITLAVIGNCLLVGTPGGSVYSTSDNGASWNNVSTGTSLNLAPEAFGMTAGFLFAGVNFKTVGIWKRAISEFGCTSVGSNLAEENFSSFHIYPNPSTGIFNFIASSNISEIEIHTTLGEKIYTKKVNSENTSINLSDKPKGVYFYQVIDNSSVLKSGRIIKE